MQEVTRDAIVSITLFAAVFGMVYIYLMTRHRERMAMLERNLVSSPFHTSNFNNFTLKTGMLLVGLSIGFFIIFIIEQGGTHSDVINVAIVCLFGGLSLIASYLVVQKQRNNQQ
ncbi:MAG: DUF6249 domain-containing protein [Bacteroidota bacterium]